MEGEVTCPRSQLVNGRGAMLKGTWQGGHCLIGPESFSIANEAPAWEMNLLILFKANFLTYQKWWEFIVQYL